MDPQIPNTVFGWEMRWVARFEVLKAHGYLLRPRYRPGWTPPWKPNNSLLSHEEAILSRRGNCLDAIRIFDGVQVFLKCVPKDSPEMAIEAYPTSAELRNDPHNHCVPLLDVISNPDEPAVVVLVFPILRPLDLPYVATIGEAIDFVEQTLQGLAYLHRHKIAHRDCNWQNILMDGRLMFPRGWHPQSYIQYPNGDYLHRANVPSRTEVGGVKYYFIDFGLSTWGKDRAVGTYGQVRAPELSWVKEYDPYLVDVWILGTGYQKYFLNFASQLEFLQPLFTSMTAEIPSQRPNPITALEILQTIVSGLGATRMSTLLRPTRSKVSLG